MSVSPVSSITQEDADFVEEWENVSYSQNYVIRLDSRGEDKPELIAGPRKFRLTTQERLITQERIVDVRNDPFLNGSFRPITTPDAITIESNPNALSDDDITRIITASRLAWDEYMSVIDSPATLRRFLEIADGMIDEGEVDVSANRLRQVQAKLDEVSPKQRLTQKDRDQYEKMGGEASPAAGSVPSMKPKSR